MSMTKAILSGKEHRKTYYDSKAIDKQCRCGGSCKGAEEIALTKIQKNYVFLLTKN